MGFLAEIFMKRITVQKNQKDLLRVCCGKGITTGYGCGLEFSKLTYSLCDTCYSNWLCTSVKGQEKLHKALNKATDRINKEKELLEAFELEYREQKSIDILLVNTRNACHKYIRIRDKGKPCISCSAKWRENFQAGHFYKAETYPTLRFSEFNIHGQCSKCNIRNNGNESLYRVGLYERYGDEYISYIDDVAKKDKEGAFSWSRDALVKIRKYYNNKIKTEI